MLSAILLYLVSSDSNDSKRHENPEGLQSIRIVSSALGQLSEKVALLEKYVGIDSFKGLVLYLNRKM